MLCKCLFFFKFCFGQKGGIGEVEPSKFKWIDEIYIFWGLKEKSN
ncbi:hypothetical protein P872_24850 [Rhodonellum psychrophilum GCM71 = DSM 17998]|uniref:Uncharacterized protein n=1 Tax=Rhodonellum psychrophilum GCM71 = DSM 17998 TaxID=1123057 RepID=U5C499_9BACT|nr:hypothetical protein P872_24850 [Rhodonellum psychrophilum GCM71 = DSM 17998]